MIAAVIAMTASVLTRLARDVARPVPSIVAVVSIVSSCVPGVAGRVVRCLLA
jgi:hypothetical protein